MKQLFGFVLFIVFNSLLNAQTTGTIKGRIYDSTAKQYLPNASISVLQASDSTLEQFTISNSLGSFEVSKLSFGNYIVQITYQGYKSILQKISVNAANAVYNFNTIYLNPQASQLQDVTIQSSPITLKKDTIEYNVNSFKTKPNAVVEDVLKKMPGMQVSKDGTITAQGEQVQRVLVDGKRFFGDDPKMATKNLPPDVVDKIQVFDGLSDQSAFSGFDDGSRVKTINIITKKDKRKGYFGRGSAGVGAASNQSVHDVSFNLSKFNGNQQLTFTGAGNNINKQNFSIQDLFGSMNSGNLRGFGGGGGGGMGGRGMGGLTNMINSFATAATNANGITNNWNGGLNYKDVWSKKTEAQGSYFYNQQSTVRDQKNITQNLIGTNPDSTIYNNQNNNNLTKNYNHRINFNIEHLFDSSNSLIIRPNISFQNTNSVTEQFTNSNKGKLVALNNTVASTQRQTEGYNSNVEITFRHRFKKKGRTFSINAQLAQNKNDGDGLNQSVIESFFLVTRKDTIDQQNLTNSLTKSTNTTFSYTEPIAKNQQIELAYNYTQNNSNNNQYTYAIDRITKNYTIPVANLTNLFANAYFANRYTLSYRFNNNKLNFSIGNGLQFGNLFSFNRSSGVAIQQQFTNLFPSANLNYTFSRSRNLRINYNGRTTQPNAQQLQPVINNADPLNIKEGNPNLQQSFNHSFRFFYNNFNLLTQKLFFATLLVNVTEKDIQNATTVLANGAQTSKPVNLSGTYNIIGYVNYGFPLRKPKSNLNFGLNVNSLQNQNLVNNQSNYTRNTSVGGMISWTTNLKEKWDVNFVSNSLYNIANYTLQPELNANFFSQFLSVEATYYNKKGWILSSDIDYTYNSGRATGFNASIPLLNASIAKQIFKNKAGEIKLYCFDIFNQNQSVTRNITANYIQDVETRVLTRYVMLSFSYNLRNFGGRNGGMPSFFGGRNGGGGRGRN